MKCARDSTWKLIAHIMKRNECNFNLQHFAIIAVFILWCCMKRNDTHEGEKCALFEAELVSLIKGKIALGQSYMDILNLLDMKKM